MSFSKYLIAACVLATAAQSYAVTYVVPPDRFEIERANAIVIGRVLQSKVETSSPFGIETVTTIALDEVIKGSTGTVVLVHEPGGITGSDAELVPGVPTFADGERVLLFLYQRSDGSYTVRNLGLGAFHFATDVAGRELAVRNEAEIEGWNSNGTPHQEEQRSADTFVHYIRSIARGEDVPADYVVPRMPLTLRSAAVHSLAVAFTATSYMLTYNSGIGTRWNVFPSSVSWNQGSFETGQLGSGAAEIAAAFANWNAAGAKYVLSSANANANGFLDATDGTNNIVFEKNLTSAGVAAFNCVNGGVLGMAGMTKAAFGGGTHVFHGETFATTIEADVSMNQGLGACTSAQLPKDLFKSGLTHELGHTLGFRHSDQNRALTSSCAGDPTLDCSSSAIMNHILASGLNGQLQPWDNTAMTMVYGSGPPCTPPAITTQPAGGVILSGNATQLSVIATGTSPLSYQWFQGVSGDVSTPVIGATGANVIVSPATTTSYWVRVTGQCAPAANSNTAVVGVTVACVPPQITSTLKDRNVLAGTAVTLTVEFTGQATAISWYQGASSNPIAFGATFTTAPLSQTTQFHARVTNACGAPESNTVTITVTQSRRRSATH